MLCGKLLQEALTDFKVMVDEPLSKMIGYVRTTEFLPFVFLVRKHSGRRTRYVVYIVDFGDDGDYEKSENFKSVEDALDFARAYFWNPVSSDMVFSILARQFYGAHTRLDDRSLPGVYKPVKKDWRPRETEKAA